jgi:hypothetical protein
MLLKSFWKWFEICPIRFTKSSQRSCVSFLLEGESSRSRKSVDEKAATRIAQAVSTHNIIS